MDYLTDQKAKENQKKFTVQREKKKRQGGLKCKKGAFSTHKPEF